MARKVTVIPANPTGGSKTAGGNGKKKRVAAYCRVSTDHEEQEGSFKNQVDYYTKLINNNPDWELAGIFADDGISGTGTKKRSGFMEMIAACDEGRVDLVITKSISRFARNTADCLNYSRKLKNLGIPIIFEKESINTMEASGELMFTILSSLAQEESRNISENTNVGIAAAKGDYIAFIDHDDFIEPDTLFRYVESINKNPDADLLFCNEDLYREQEGEEQRYYGARFKPGWNPDLLFGSNYVCHMLCVSRKAINETVRSGADVAGAQDYDLTFKTCERARSIVHVPYLLYHWRDHAGSTATHRETKPYALEAGRLSIQRHFERKGIKAEVSPAEYPFSYRVRYAMPDDMKASVIVVATLGDGVSGCIESIAEHTHAYAKEIIVAATQANLLPNGLDGVKKISANSRIWSMLANEGARAATGDVLVFVDEHCLVTDDGWLESTIEYLMRPEVGCAAPMAVYPDHTVCSVGGMIASDGTVTYQSHNLPEVVDGYMIFHKIAHDCSIVPPILLAVRRGDFERLGAFSKELGAPYAVADFCLKLHEEGKACVVQPFSRVTCREIYGERLVQSEAQQKELLLLRHSQMVSADPYVDPSFDRDKSYYHTYFMSDGKA